MQADAQPDDNSGKEIEINQANIKKEVKPKAVASNKAVPSTICSEDHQFTSNDFREVTDW